MTRTCMVAFCCNNLKSKRNNQNLKFFGITPARHKSWMTALNRNPADKVHSGASVCSEHFLPEDFVTLNTTRTLRVGAIPTIKLKASEYGFSLYSTKTSIRLSRMPKETSTNLSVGSTGLPSTSTDKNGTTCTQNADSSNSDSESDYTFSLERNNYSSYRKTKNKISTAAMVWEAKLNLERANKKIDKQRKKIKQLQKSVGRFRSKSGSLSLLVKYLRKNNMVTEMGESVIKAFRRK